MVSTMTNAIRGRSQLAVWLNSKPDNFFTADTNLQNVLRYYLNSVYADLEPQLIAFGGQVATSIDEAAKVEDQLGNHPRLQRWSGIGERTESIEFHPNHERIGHLVWQTGIMALQRTPGHTVAQMGLYYLLGHNGEGGHMCSLACTSGLIRVLQQVADEPVRAKFLPPLLEPEFDAMQHGAQFLTEIQGGSDVGANAVTATDNGDGTWRINGEKWFCSNINADQFLLTARPVGAPEGTKGLGLFVVPRRLDDGAVNGLYIRRLKDKIGTRTLASAEVDFRDAFAYPVGPLDRGFKNVVELVLNTSRLMNAFGCTAIMHRAYLEAASYACQRQAFGQPISNYPMVQEAVGDILSETYGAVASSFYVARLLDQIETGQASDDDSAVFRLLVNANKYLTSIQATEAVHRAIEVLGGNGAIETFSILPRLYRDVLVFENWEGTHNVLCLQVMRDIVRYGIYDPFARAMQKQLETISQPSLADCAQIVREALDRTTVRLNDLLRLGDEHIQAHARRFVDSLSRVAQATLMLVEAEWEFDNQRPTSKPDALNYYVNRHLRPGYDPLVDPAYLSLLQRLVLTS
jgi:acyl-CoA dehydrogenase